MKKPILNFSITIVFVILIVFGIHELVLTKIGKPLLEDSIVLSYVINTILAISIFSILFFLKNRYKSELGFIFMAGSALKFIVFFIVFYPAYKRDGIITSSEFAAFFVPYLCCLFIETLSLSKLLNKLD